jgi:hypothetical protein
MLMIPAMIEKFGYISTLILMYGRSQISSIDVQPAIPDGLIGLLFIVAFWATRTSEGSTSG